MANEWIIEARENFAIGGEILSFTDETNSPINLSDKKFTLLIKNWGREQEMTLESGNFVLQPITAPATFPTKVEFKMPKLQVFKLQKGENRFELLIANNADELEGILTGTIVKK